jgi:hypothetical protein
MKKFKLLLLLIFLLPCFSNGQKRDDLERRISRLEKIIDTLKLQFSWHNKSYDHSSIETNRYRSQLALMLNRNFTYAAGFYEGDADTKDGKGYQRVFYFNGYLSVDQQNKSLQYNQSEYLKTVRQNLIVIRNLIVGEQSEPIKYSDEYTFYPNRLIINYYDNVSGGEPIISADTDMKSLKVRINGVMQEVGWE